MNRHALREAKTRDFNRQQGRTRRAVLILCEEDGCWSKFPYGSWEEAENAAIRTMDDIPVRRALLAYACDFCDKWHVGGDAPRIRNRVLTGTPRGWSMGDWNLFVPAL